MPFRPSNHLIETFSGINDEPVAPTETKAGNGAHLINTYNNFLHALRDALIEVCPCSCIHWHQDSHVISGNPISSNRHEWQFFKDWWLQYPAAVGDSFKFYATLREGVYVLKVLTTFANDSGILALDVDGVRQEGTLDLYAPDWNLNNVVSTFFQLNTSDKHEFKFTVVDKNPSSNGYQAPITKFAIYPQEMYF